MSTDILALAYFLRVASATSSHPLKLSHAQQLTSAALGYKTLASYQASSEEPPTIESGINIIIDESLLNSRLNELDIKLGYSQLIEMFKYISKTHLNNVRIHSSESEFFDYLNDEVQSQVENDENVVSQMAMTNSDGVGEVYVPFDFCMDDLPDIGVALNISIEGHVSMELDDERPYSGHRIDVKVNLSIERVGRTLIRDPDIQVENAQLDYNWGDDEPIVSFAQALADELQLDLTEAEQLVDVDIQELSGNSGEMTYSFLLDFTDVAPPEIARKIFAKYESLQVEVNVNFFDRVKNGFD